MPIRLGPLGLTPSVAVTNLGVDTNVFNSSVDPQQDFTLTATPRLQARLRSGRMLLSGTLASGFVYYQKFDDQRSIDYSTQGRADVDLGWFQPYALAERIDTRDRFSVELDLRAPRVSTVVEGGGRMVFSPTTGFRFDARRSTVTFEDGQVFEGVPLSDTLTRPEELDRVLSHELVHALVTNIGGRTVPAWISEGLASVLEPAGSAELESRLKPADTPPRLSKLHRNFGGFSARDADIAYALSARAVRRLIEQHGAASLVALLQDLSRGAAFARAFQERLGVQYEEFAAFAERQ